VDDQPLLPRYADDNVRGIMPALLGPGSTLPAWVPAVVSGARAVVVLVLDGLGWEQLQARTAQAPTLAAMLGAPITTVAPSTTASALTSITTGLTPGEHGIVGYRMEMHGQVINTLRWWTERGDARRTVDPARVQPFAPFLGIDVPVVSKADLEHTAFTEAHLRGSRLRGWRAPSSIAPQIAELIDAGERLVYAYYDGVDKIAHERGFGSYYDAELRFADALVAEVLAQLSDDVALLITADHGQVDVGDRIVHPSDEVAQLARQSSGEGRFRWLHARPGASADLAAAAADAHGDLAWVVTREQVIDEHWLGRVVSPPVAARLGDVALVAHAPVSFHDPADSGPYPLVCRHGSLTSAEMLVPLLAARGCR
jgi:predicted AlkP superfamily pyrophosphatase or phosphodiesterase